MERGSQSKTRWRIGLPHAKEIPETLKKLFMENMPGIRDLEDLRRPGAHSGAASDILGATRCERSYKSGSRTRGLVERVRIQHIVNGTRT